MNKKKIWRIIVFIIALGYIIYIWVEKDILAIYSSMPAEQALSLVVTTVVVSLVKVGVLTAGILIVKCLAGKLKK